MIQPEVWALAVKLLEEQRQKGKPKGVAEVRNHFRNVRVLGCWYYHVQWSPLVIFLIFLAFENKNMTRPRCAGPPGHITLSYDPGISVIFYMTQVI